MLCRAAIPLNVSPGLTVYVLADDELELPDPREFDDDEEELDDDESVVFNTWFGKMMSDVSWLTDFRWETVVPYFWAMDHNVSPRCTLYVVDASASSAPSKAAAMAALAVTDITIFLFAKSISSFENFISISNIRRKYHRSVGR